MPTRFTRPMPAGLLLLLVPMACVTQRPLDAETACPCAPHWTCDVQQNVCVPAPGNDAVADVAAVDATGSVDAAVDIAVDTGISPTDADAGTGMACDTSGLAPISRGSVDVVAACAAAGGPPVPYSSPADLAALAVGAWYRCEGPIQPVGSPVAPDGQVGLLFDRFPGSNQGDLSGLLPNDGPCFGKILAYIGGGNYADVSWAYSPVNGQPGVVFQDGRGGVIYDSAVFSAGGTRLTLVDPIWDGTYVKLTP